ncbi:MAG TPA: MerR family transcriptional regulator [Pseudobdellovibrionaceae bacterium]|nr:MerR family transcriptional regulator [Pseudobdellovibrionaceae bacterium]
MKNWLTIGQFSKKIGVSSKALRLYERIGLIKSHTRGENGYRYYDSSQLELAMRLKDFKKLGFTLAEIKGLLQADRDLGSDKIAEAMKARLMLITDQVDQLSQQRMQIEKILISLEKKSEPLKAQQRRAIMSFYGKVSVVVTGCDGLEKTAKFIQRHFQVANQKIPIIHWKKGVHANQEKPYILVIKEADLASDEINRIHPDVIVIKSLGVHSDENQQNYLKLYSSVGPHVNTIMNADDRSSVELASQSLLRKGRIFYFSKNKGLEPQIKKIGGVMSDGEEIEIHGFNLKPEVINLKLEKIMTFEDEIALLSSLGAVMTVGLEKENLQTN